MQIASTVFAWAHLGASGHICDSVQETKSLGTPLSRVAYKEVLPAGLETGVPGKLPFTLS